MFAKVILWIGGMPTIVVVRTVYELYDWGEVPKLYETL